jgi:hypothetical protein
MLGYLLASLKFQSKRENWVFGKVPPEMWLEFARPDLQRREVYLIVDLHSNSFPVEKASL